MNRSEDDRFADIVDAIQRCQDYAPHLRSADLGSMATTLCCATARSSARPCGRCQPRRKDAIPDVPWASIAGLRTIVVHEYFRVNPDLVLDIFGQELVDLARAIHNR